MGTTISLAGASEPVALQSDLMALAARVTKLESEIGPSPPVLTPSPANTFVTAPNPTKPIVDAALNQWFLVTAVPPATGYQIAVIAKGASAPPVIEPPSNAVVELGVQAVPAAGAALFVVQKNATGGCYYATAPGAWVEFPGPVPP
jgi:hypothetical protein